MTDLDGMRSATPEERDSVNFYVESISTPAGNNFWDYLLVHQKVPCKLEVTNVIKHRSQFDFEDIDENACDVDDI